MQMRRRQGGTGGKEDEVTSPSLSTTKPKKKSTSGGSDSILPLWLVVVICALFLIIGFHKQSGDSSGASSPQKRRRQTIDKSLKKSLLSPEEDDALEIDSKTGLRYHLVFSTDCSPYQHWQSYLVYFSAMKVKQPGHVTRIVSGCNEEEATLMNQWFEEDVQFLSKRFHIHLTPKFSSVKNEKGEEIGDYKFFNKPFGLKYWMEHAPLLNYDENSNSFPDELTNDVVILIDPDMGLFRPITADFSDPTETIISNFRKEHYNATINQVSPGHPFAQVYGFGTQWQRLDLEKIAGKGTPAASVSQEDGRLYYPVGPPYIGTVPDMHAISVKWSAFVPGVYEQYPHLLAEMFAFCIAAAHLELPFHLIDSLMISDIGAGGEGWPLIDQIEPANEVCDFAYYKSANHSIHPVPSVFHMCQRYAIGENWFFSKRKIPSDIYDCETPLFQEPPADLATKYNYKTPPGGKKTPLSPQEAKRNAFAVCYLYGLVNEAATFYKRNSCTPESINFEKTRSLAQYAREHQK